jgi:glycosyltransferase involved in cell wall biosynthesis
MTRIAYVSADPGVPIFGNKGCSIHAQEVLAALRRRGAQVELFTTSGEGQPPAELEGVNVHRLPRPSKGDAAAREQGGLAGNISLRMELEGAQPFDFVYERYSLWSHAALEYARDAGVPGLLEVNAPLIEEQARYRVLLDRAGAERSAERAFRAASSLLAVSEEVARWLERFPTVDRKVHVVSNGIRPERFPADLEPSLPAPPGVFTVGFVGSLKAWHGLSVLVEAFALLHARRPATRLLIVGDGPEGNFLRADLARRGLDAAAVLTGAVPPNQVPPLVVSMDAAVAPYPRLEQFYFSPLKVYEYMAAGVAVVASRIGQLEKLIRPKVDGLLVAPGNAAELALALDWLANNPEMRARLGHTARRKVLTDHTWDGVAEKILGLAGQQPAALSGSPMGA